MKKHVQKGWLISPKCSELLYIQNSGPHAEWAMAQRFEIQHQQTLAITFMWARHVDPGDIDGSTVYPALKGRRHFLKKIIEHFKLIKVECLMPNIF